MHPVHLVETSKFSPTQLLIGAALFGMPALLAATVVGATEPEAMPRMMAATEMRPGETTTGEARPDLVSHGQRLPYMTTEPVKDPDMATVNPDESAEPPRGMLRIDVQSIYLPRPVAHTPPEILLFRGNEVGLAKPQRQRLDAIATVAKERADTAILIVAVGTHAGDLQAIRLAKMRADEIRHHLFQADLPESRVLETVRLARSKDFIPKGGVAVGLIAR